MSTYTYALSPSVPSTPPSDTRNIQSLHPTKYPTSHLLSLLIVYRLRTIPQTRRRPVPLRSICKPHHKEETKPEVGIPHHRFRAPVSSLPPKSHRLVCTYPTACGQTPSWVWAGKQQGSHGVTPFCRLLIYTNPVHNHLSTGLQLEPQSSHLVVNP